MRSISATILLALFAAITAGIAGLRLSKSDLARVFGAPPTRVGEVLYDFDPAEVTQIQLAGNGTGAICAKGENGWEVISPWNDRMDPRIVQALFQFALASKVEGVIPTEKVESVNLGFGDGKISIRMADDADDPLAKFTIGHQSAWVGTDPETGDPIPLVYVQPRDRSRKDYLYACTNLGNIQSQLGDGLENLRDHHPFLFHPTIVETIRIRNVGGELLLSRNSSKTYWNIAKPLGLKSDTKALTRLVQGLFDLKAISVKKRSQVTLPTEDSGDIDQIAIRFFGQEDEIVLDIYPPETPDATSVLAKISDRPDSVFELPLISTPTTEETAGLVGLRDLPLSVNALRDPTLTSIDPGNLKSIMISPAVGSDILIRRETPRERFRMMLDGELRRPNETALFSLLKAITDGQVAGFTSDTATDLSPYGLDTPFLVLRFLSFVGETIQLDFGQAADGKIHAIRKGTTSVVEIDQTLLALIPTRLWDWKDTTLWEIDAIDVTNVTRTKNAGDPLQLTQNPITETWTAKQDEKDRSGELSTVRAEGLLRNLLDLKATNWLRPGENAAAEAFEKPSLIFSVFAKEYGADGDFKQVVNPKLTIARVKRGEIEVCYGRISTHENPFLLDPEQVDLLEVDLFGDD